MFILIFLSTFLLWFEGEAQVLVPFKSASQHVIGSNTSLTAVINTTNFHNEFYIEWRWKPTENSKPETLSQCSCTKDADYECESQSRDSNFNDHIDDFVQGEEENHILNLTLNFFNVKQHHSGIISLFMTTTEKELSSTHFFVSEGKAETGDSSMVISSTTATILSTTTLIYTDSGSVTTSSSHFNTTKHNLFSTSSKFPLRNIKISEAITTNDEIVISTTDSMKNENQTHLNPNEGESNLIAVLAAITGVVVLLLVATIPTCWRKCMLILKDDDEDKQNQDQFQQL